MGRVRDRPADRVFDGQTRSLRRRRAGRHRAPIPYPSRTCRSSRPPPCTATSRASRRSTPRAWPARRWTRPRSRRSLPSAGFEGGVERRFTARARPLTEVVAPGPEVRLRGGRHRVRRVVRVARPRPPRTRRRSRADPPDVPGAVAFRHGVSGCCTKDTFQYIAAWTRGPYAITLLVGGPDAGRRSASPLAAGTRRPCAEGWMS